MMKKILIVIIALSLPNILLAAGNSNKNPHNIFNEDGAVDKTTCNLCHDEMPDGDVPDDETLTFEEPLTEYCYGCHLEYVTDHPVGVTHTGVYMTIFTTKCMEKARAAKEDILNISKLPLIEERYESMVFCGTCHLPHRKITDKKEGDDKDGIRRGFVICIACHCDEPR